MAGVEVPDLAGIHEGYSVRRVGEDHHHFTVNVSAERLPAVVRALAACVREPGFLVVEVPEPLAFGSVRRDVGTTPPARDVHYLDGLSTARFLELFAAHEALLLQDGEVGFGYGAHEGTDEIFVGAYKIVSIFADDARKYATALATLGYGMEDQIRTVWQNFSPSAPGTRRVLKVDDRTVLDVLEALRDHGLYRAERRVE